MKTKQIIRYLLAIHIAWQAVFFYAALILLLVYSLLTSDGLKLRLPITLLHFKQLVVNETYRQAFRNSFLLAFATSSMATMIALPVSHGICSYLTPRIRVAFLYFLLLPMFCNYVVRMFCWQLIIADSGILNSYLRLLDCRYLAFHALYTTTGTMIGLLTLALPLAIMSVYLSQLHLDPTLAQAARNLGATPLMTYVRVIAPRIMTGITFAFVLSFAVAFGDFVSVGVLGGRQFYTASIIVSDRLRINDWSLAASTGIGMLATSILVGGSCFLMLRTLPVGARRPKGGDA